ncbi:MAG: DNA polymerase/3'-5' exonuclease PolX [Candidatus Margulisiibacteriota bacterium]
MENAALAKILSQISIILELKEDNLFKIRSYQKAVSNIENLAESVSEIYKKGGRKALEEIDGIGSGISERIEEILTTGKSSYLEELHKDIPESVVEMLGVQGVGPKLVIRLYKDLGIKSVDELLSAAKKGVLEKLDGVREKRIENIIKGIENLKKMDKKHLIGEALPYAEILLRSIGEKPFVSKAIICGSLRRMKETIGDIDILAVSSDPKRLSDVFTSLPQVIRVTAKGETKSSVVLENNMNADLRIVKEDEFGSASHYFTGSKQHNIKIRKIAISKGLKVSEYGVFKGSKRIAGKTEDELFNALGMQYIPPELREDSGEIEAAQRKTLPNLLEITDIKGDLHMHSDYTDGTASIEEMARAAKKLGYKYIAITDHSKSTKVAGGLTEKELLKQMDEIDGINKKLPGFKILKGSEVDILKDGSLDFSDGLLSRLDIIVASIHSGFSASKDEMTKRIIKAMRNKLVNIIAHPTGRLLGKRLPYEVDIEKILSEAAKTHTIFELNSYPDRLDLNDVHCRLAKEKGVKISINTDSHSTNNLLYMKFGVGTARRGWLTKKDVINTLGLKDLLDYLK